MVNNRVPSVFSKTYVTPRRPFEKARLDQELKIIGEYGLRNKREVWRVKYTLARIRKAARELLTLEEKDPKRLFEGESLYLDSSFFIYLSRGWWTRVVSLFLRRYIFYKGNFESFCMGSCVLKTNVKA